MARSVEGMLAPEGGGRESGSEGRVVARLHMGVWAGAVQEQLGNSSDDADAARVHHSTSTRPGGGASAAPCLHHVSKAIAQLG